MPATDQSALFLSVLEAHKGIIFKVANAYCGHTGDRPDLVQEITLQLWRSFDRYTGQAKYTTWIYRIALNTAISFYRKERNKTQIYNELPLIYFDFTPSEQPDDLTEEIRLLQQFIAELRAFDRALILLHLEEKSHREISDIMGISVTNVATKLSRIKKVLKQKFSTTKL